MDSAAMDPEQSAISTPAIFDGSSIEKSNTGQDFALKVRKPYTITKQRERWTDEEHKKFIEALKLYGRAWRKIEEHVGTKTAVQIRSHAQKFFGKVARESSNGESGAGSAKSIEIPPPRPKRKPTHPYPRKLVSPAKRESSSPEKQMIPVSPKFSEQDNLSPTSVLSTIGSDSSVGLDSFAPVGSPSSGGTGSSATTPKLVSEGTITSRNDEIVLLELELSSQTAIVIKEDPSESSATAQSLKLFGQTVLVDRRDTCKMNLTDTSVSERVSNDRFPWLTLCCDVRQSQTEVHSPTPIKARLMRNNDKNEGLSSMEMTTSFSLCKLSLNRRKGFVPYKRCLSEKEKAPEDREQRQQRIRLCL
ncbi:protein REVEILLE 2-like [Andrographis paniculata]|uniref:protein REVEILLE 2-like n=1 Tax=Andrographis paniculata TaxID=175694 RepID=UPI0021E95220|nr:protein REVEILLE 2-like [Andrographis paniculata]